MSRSRRPPRYQVAPGSEVLTDVAALAAYGPDVVTAAESIIDDLAHGRVVGKDLGQRRVSGDLTGLARVKFDVPGSQPPRFRLLYRQIDEASREIVAIGPRDEHAIYQIAVSRLARRGSPQADPLPGHLALAQAGSARCWSEAVTRPSRSGSSMDPRHRPYTREQLPCRNPAYLALR